MANQPLIPDLCPNPSRLHAPTNATCRLGRLLLLCLEGLLAIAPYHDSGEESADNGSGKDNEDDGNADGPDAGREEGLDRVRVVDEGL